jgi:hypothetical protein
MVVLGVGSRSNRVPVIHPASTVSSLSVAEYGAQWAGSALSVREVRTPLGDQPMHRPGALFIFDLFTPPRARFVHPELNASTTRPGRLQAYACRSFCEGWVESFCPLWIWL